jgi:hypothetical protein
MWLGWDGDADAVALVVGAVRVGGCEGCGAVRCGARLGFRLVRQCHAHTHAARLSPVRRRRAL